MPFPAKLLNDGEQVVLDLHPHWRYLAVPVGAAVVVLAGAIAAAVRGVPRWAAWLVLAVLVLAIGWLLARYLEWLTTNLVVTTARLVRRKGVLAKTGREIPLDHLNDISYRQSLFDRMIGAGDLVLESAGREGQEVFADVPHPARIQNEIYRQIEAGRNRQADRMAGRRELSIPEQIDKLDELRRRGVITPAEFEAKKAQLLDRL
ncbi:MAG: PH domain-containing protein [Acidimicrobiales bacterium]